MKSKIATPIRLCYASHTFRLKSGSDHEQKKNKLKSLSKNLKTILVLAFIVILSSCSTNDDDTPTTTPEQIYPPYEYKSNVYVVGFENSKAKIWKNGVGTDLPNGTSAKSVFVSGNDVYTCGVQTVREEVKVKFGKIVPYFLLYQLQKLM